MNAAFLAGRSVARCAHPFAAWRVGSLGTRCTIVVGYMVGAYVATFIGLQFVAF
jgi:hypothetical protein